MFGIHCSQASLGREHRDTRYNEMADLQHYPPPLLKSEASYDLNLDNDNCLLRPRYRPWYQDHNFPIQNSMFASSNQAAIYKSEEETCFALNSNGSESNCDENTFTDNHHSYPCPPVVQAEADILDDIFQGNERRNFLSDPEKRSIFSAHGTDETSSHWHRNVDSFSPRETDHQVINLSPNSESYVPKKLSCSSSNNNNNADFENSLESEEFATEAVFSPELTSNTCFPTYTSQSEVQLSPVSRSSKSVTSENSFKPIQTDAEKNAELMQCQSEATNLENNDRAKNSTTLPPISLLTEKKFPGNKEETQQFAPATVTSSSSVPTYTNEERSGLEMQQIIYENETLPVENYGDLLNKPSNYCLYGQRAPGQIMMESSEMLRNLSRSK